jgi:diadenosine tetraphosphate (Ap4A) HIT family hydrolase/5-methylcytosine-specific restriction endonuclease McrA
MTFEQLVDFIQNRMRMSHIYQPVMLLTLLEHDGDCSQTEIAKAISMHDPTQIEYYEAIARNMVGRVLTRHGLVRRDGKFFRLVFDRPLSREQRDRLRRLLVAKRDEYIAKRGERIWQHRKLALGDISGTVKYEVLRRAGTRCELCGISNHERALEVDHVVPRNHGGTDDLGNLQALCYRCNAMKRDRDATDLRALRESYAHRDEKCPFCFRQKTGNLVLENELCFGIEDGFPVTHHHMLVIPKRHVSDFFALYEPERHACVRLLSTAKQKVKSQDPTVAGFNVGINVGEAAGQTVDHCHIHLIPRRRGDVAQPRGGVRNVIPEKGNY